MKDRTSLTGTPELGLKNAITYHDSVDEYGHRVFEALQRVSDGKWVQQIVQITCSTCEGHKYFIYWGKGSFSFIFLCQ